MYNQFEAKPVVYIENDENTEEIDVNQLIGKVKANNIILFRKINNWEYEYSKYFYDEDCEEYGAICSIRYKESLGDNSIKIDENTILCQ